MEVSLAGLKCICGKSLNHEPNHAICAACGLVKLEISRHLAQISAIRSGRSKGTVHTVKTITKNLKILTCEVFSSTISKISKRQK